jgi:hypothetical protein
MILNGRHGTLLREARVNAPPGFTLQVLAPTHIAYASLWAFRCNPLAGESEETLLLDSLNYLCVLGCNQ